MKIKSPGTFWQGFFCVFYININFIINHSFKRRRNNKETRNFGFNRDELVACNGKSGQAPVATAPAKNSPRNGLKPRCTIRVNGENITMMLEKCQVPNWLQAEMELYDVRKDGIDQIMMM
jgi:hypothetical protein